MKTQLNHASPSSHLILEDGMDDAEKDWAHHGEVLRLCLVGHVLPAQHPEVVQIVLRLVYIVHDLDLVSGGSLMIQHFSSSLAFMLCDRLSDSTLIDCNL